MKVLGLVCLSPLAEAVADAAEDMHVGRWFGFPITDGNGEYQDWMS